MPTIFLIALLLTTELFAVENAWTKNTPALSSSKSEAIIKAYEENNTSKIIFDDDPKKVTDRVFDENIFMVGIAMAYEANSEKTYNKSGDKTENFSATNLTLTLGKDFTLWHEDNTEPTRLYMTYSYSNISADVSYSSYTLGLKENMFYWSIYKDAEFNLYPTLYLEMGSSSLTRNEQDISGFTTLYGAGITLAQHKNFEYMLNFHLKNIDWEHPVEGVADEMNVYSFTIGVNYKLMYGDI